MAGGAIIGMLALKWEFVLREKTILLILCGLFIVQTVLALARYGRQSSFHTLLAKTAAVLQGAVLGDGCQGNILDQATSAG